MDEYYRISLRIWHPAASAVFIADAIGIPAQTMHSVGLPRLTRDGKRLEGTYKETVCSFILCRKTIGDFTNALQDFQGFLVSKQVFFEKMKREDARMDLYIAVFVNKSAGFVLKSSLASAICGLGIDLSVEYFFD